MLVLDGVSIVWAWHRLVPPTPPTSTQLTCGLEADGVVDVAWQYKAVVLHQACIGLAGLLTQVGYQHLVTSRNGLCESRHT